MDFSGNVFLFSKIPGEWESERLRFSSSVRCVLKKFPKMVRKIRFGLSGRLWKNKVSTFQRKHIRMKYFRVSQG